MTKLLFWRPELKNILGHVALKTDRYYVSFRPTKGLPGGNKIKTGIPVSQIMEAMQGCLVLYQSIDRKCEGDCDPIEYEIIEAANNEDVNSVIEEFLRYNGIDPEDVTIERCEDLYKKRREYKQLPPEEAKNAEEPEKPVKLLPKTEYSYSVELMSGKKEEVPFYHKQQSCVSLIFNVIQTVWLMKRHPDQSSPISNPVELITDLPFQTFYKVPWLEKVVHKHLMSTSSTTMESTDKVGKSSEMPTVYIWYPDKKTRFGHAALQTDKYHISFWSDGDTKDYGLGEMAISGIPGSLVFHQERDRNLEDDRLPTATYQIDTVTNEAINRIHEEFLRYNGIDPVDVTMEAGEKLLDENKTPEVSVKKTPYTFAPDIRGQVTLFDVLLPVNFITGKPPWYHCKQSCLSFCYHVIDNADPKRQGIARKLLKLYDFVTLQTIVDNYTVPWFESHVKKYCVRNSLLHTFNIGDNSVTRSARYLLWDRWTSSSQTEEIGRIPQFLSRGHKVFQKMKQNKLISFFCLTMLIVFFNFIEEHIGTSDIFQYFMSNNIFQYFISNIFLPFIRNIFPIFLPFFFLYFPAN